MDQPPDDARLYRALMATLDTVSPVSPGDDQAALWKSITDASSEEKAFTERVVSHAAHIRVSTQEIQSWSWPADFAVPLGSPSPARTLHPPAIDTSAIATATYWGCLRADQVLYYQTRIDQIQADLSNSDLDHQRAHIREIYVNPKTRTMHNALSISTTFAVMATLPRYAQLKQLLALWSARLEVLYRAPAFAEEIERAASALAEAWSSIGIRRNPATGLCRARTVKLGLNGMFRGTFNQLRSALEAEVAGVWGRVDDMVDTLNAHGEKVPQSWIDLAERLERDYTEWTFDAQRQVLKYEFRLDDSPAAETTPPSPRHSRRQSPKLQIPGSWRDSILIPVDGSGKFEPLPMHPALGPTPALRPSTAYGASSPTNNAPATPARPSTAHGASPADIIRAHVRRHVSHTSLRDAAAPHADDVPPVPALTASASSDDDYTSVYDDDDDSSACDSPVSPAPVFQDAPEIPVRSPLRKAPPRLPRTSVFTEQTDDIDILPAGVTSSLPRELSRQPEVVGAKVSKGEERPATAPSTPSKKKRPLVLRGLGRAKFWRGH